MLIQLTGLSGAGKTTLAQKVSEELAIIGLSSVVLDGDVYRKTLCKDLGFSYADRIENIRRLGALAYSYTLKGDIAIISAINPFEVGRRELQELYGAKTIWIDCALDILQERDTKGLYKRASLPDGHPEKLDNLTGVNDKYEEPRDADLRISTHLETVEQSAQRIVSYLKSGLPLNNMQPYLGLNYIIALQGIYPSRN